jgi:hypothetical protein
MDLKLEGIAGIMHNFFTPWRSSFFFGNAVACHAFLGLIGF